KTRSPRELRKRSAARSARSRGLREEPPSQQGSSRPIEQDLEERRMTIERRRNLNLNPTVPLRDRLHDFRQVEVNMPAERQKIRDHDNAAGPAFHQPLDGAPKVGCTELQKRGLDNGIVCGG